MTCFSLFAELKAKPGKEEEVAAFLSDAQGLVAAEPGTTAWFAVRFDTHTFAVFDAFNDETGLLAHLTGRIAEALHAHSEELFASSPVIRSANVLADKLPSSEPRESELYPSAQLGAPRK
jgi:quinol monooxygenase YgiN